MPMGGFRELFELAAGDRNALVVILLDREMEKSGRSEEDIVRELAAQWRRMRGDALQALAESAESMESRQLVQAAMETWRPSRKTSMSAQSIDLMMTIAVLYWNGNPSAAVLTPPGAEATLAAVMVTLTEGMPVTAEQLLVALFVARCVSGMLNRHILLHSAGQDCRHSCGLIAAPAAAALTTLSGGSADEISNAIAFSLLRCANFECLPVGEMVRLPCAARNAAQALGALISTDSALQGEVPETGPDEALLRLCTVIQ